jgi:simple sugar transport system permease protein
VVEQVLILISQTILVSVPFVLAALGGTCSERGGVVNIALEGILLGAAFTTAAVAWSTGSAWLGLVGGVAAGIAISALHAMISVSLKVDQIISGLAINILVSGATEYGMHLLWAGTTSRTIPVLPSWTLLEGGGVSDLINTLFGRPVVIATMVLIPAVWALHEKTRFGLRLRATGDNPGAAATLGVSVARIRTQGVLLSGGLAGLGGAWLAFNISQFQHGMSAGKGFIAMAAVVSGKWNPLGATAACLLFGFSEALAAACERWGLSVPSELISTLPYVLTIALVAGFVGRARAPQALGIPYGD